MYMTQILIFSDLQTILHSLITQSSTLSRWSTLAKHQQITQCPKETAALV